MFEFERTIATAPLMKSWTKISSRKRLAGLDNIDIDFYRYDAKRNIEKLHSSLASKSYRPYREKSFHSGERQYFVSCIEDKIVQTSVAEVVSENIKLAKNIHGYVKNHSVDTARKSLQTALNKGITKFFKVDIRKFYESIDVNFLLKQVGALSNEKEFCALVESLVKNHSATVGISTGSCLSPVLSNLYLEHFDRVMSENTGFYSRYVDDMLVAPIKGGNMSDAIYLVTDTLRKLKLELNMEKSSIVNAEEGFRYLGFDIIRAAKNKTIDALITDGKFALAEKLFEIGAKEIEDENEITYDFNEYISFFAANTDKFYVSETPEERYSPRDGLLNNAALNWLVANNKEFAVPALNNGKKCEFCVFDIDVNRQIILNHGDDGDIFNKLLDETKMLADEIKKRIEQIGAYAYIEFSGYKGYHIWTFWKETITISQQKKFIANIMIGLDIPAGIHIEKFPICDDGQKIKLPLSRHAIHGKQSYFVNAAQDIDSQLAYISRIYRSEYPDVCRETETEQTVVTDKNAVPEHITAIYDKCHIVRKLVDKAKSENYLNYQERNTLLCIFHPLGDSGDRYVHNIIKNCVNYDYGVTQKYIGKCNITIPIGCKKLAERFDDIYGKSGCNCVFKEKDIYATPVIHAMHIAPGCYKKPSREETIGHFSPKPDRHSIGDSVSQLLELNRKEYDIHSQQHVFRERIGMLFEKNDITELTTPQGTIIKTENGLFMKL